MSAELLRGANHGGTNAAKGRLEAEEGGIAKASKQARDLITPFASEIKRDQANCGEGSSHWLSKSTVVYAREKIRKCP